MVFWIIIKQGLINTMTNLEEKKGGAESSSIRNNGESGFLVRVKLTKLTV
jgi:hypothetical protein